MISSRREGCTLDRRCAKVRGLAHVPIDLRVQLAALNSRQAAIEQGVEMQVRHWDLIGSKVLSIERLALSESRGTMYGIQVGPFWDVGSATNLCTQLKSQGQDCFVVP